MSDLLGLLFLLAGGTIILTVNKKNSRLLTILFVAFSVRSLFALVHYYVIPLPDSQADAVMFERIAAEWAQSGFPGVLVQFRTGAFLYSWIIAVLYSILGRNPLMAQAINVLFGTLIVRNVYLLAQLLWGDRFASRSAWCATFFPTLVLYSAITMREVAVVFPLTLGALYFVQWLKRDRLRDFLKALVAWAVSIAFHTGVLPVILVISLAGFRKWLDALVTARTKAVVRRLFAVCFVIFGICAILGVGWGLEKLGGVAEAGNFVEWLANQQRIAARDRAAYLSSLQPRNLLDLVWQTPIRMVYFLFMPFPWLVRSSADLLGLIIAALNFLLILLIFRSFPKVWANKERRWIFYTLLILLIAFALTTSNYGTAVRHSSKLVPLALAVIQIPKVKL